MAGRQCMKMASSAALDMMRSSTVYAGPNRRRLPGSSCMDEWVSVMTTSAPAAAPAGLAVCSTEIESRASSTTLARGRSRRGVATDTSMPARAHPCMSELQTLLPSPIQHTRRPRSRPFRSRIVSRSASVWHGWNESDRPFTTGTPEWAASSSRSECSKTRAMITSTYLERVDAVSAIVSPRDSCVSEAERLTAWPPSWNMPASKLTRVRVDGFWNIMAMVAPASSVPRERPAARRRLRRPARSRRRPVSLPSISANVRKSLVRSLIF